MPNLPTVLVTDAQATRIIAAFGGATTAESVTLYKKWLISGLREFIRHQELAGLHETHALDVAQLDESIKSELPNPDLIV